MIYYRRSLLSLPIDETMFDSQHQPHPTTHQTSVQLEESEPRPSSDRVQRSPMRDQDEMLPASPKQLHSAIHRQPRPRDQQPHPRDQQPHPRDHQSHSRDHQSHSHDQQPHPHNKQQPHPSNQKERSRNRKFVL